jgi:hypothetical protein
MIGSALTYEPRAPDTLRCCPTMADVIIQDLTSPLLHSSHSGPPQLGAPRPAAACARRLVPTGPPVITAPNLSLICWHAARPASVPASHLSLISHHIPNILLNCPPDASSPSSPCTAEHFARPGSSRRHVSIADTWCRVNISGIMVRDLIRTCQPRRGSPLPRRSPPLPGSE